MALEGLLRLVQMKPSTKKMALLKKTFLEKFIFGDDGKILTVRQWRAAW